MKKLSKLVLVLTLVLVSVLPISAQGDGSLTIEGPSTLKAGDSFSYIVKINQSEEMFGIQFSILFDSKIFENIKVNTRQAFAKELEENGASIKGVYAKENATFLAYWNSKATLNGSLDVMVITGQVKKDISDSSITLEISESEWVDSTMKGRSFSVVNKDVTITASNGAPSTVAPTSPTPTPAVSTGNIVDKTVDATISDEGKIILTVKENSEISSSNLNELTQIGGANLAVNDSSSNSTIQWNFSDEVKNDVIMVLDTSITPMSKVEGIKSSVVKQFDENAIMIDFKHRGKFISTAEINVSTLGLYTDGEVVGCFSYDGKTGQIDEIHHSLAVKDGAVTLVLDEGKTYVIAKTFTKQTSNSLYFVGGAIVVIVILSSSLFLKKKKS